MHSPLLSLRSTGQKPRAKYGHTCAALPGGKRIALLGGVRFGGYQGDVGDFHVLHFEFDENPAAAEEKDRLRVRARWDQPQTVGESEGRAHIATAETVKYADTLSPSSDGSADQSARSGAAALSASGHWLGLQQYGGRPCRSDLRFRRDSRRRIERLS